MPITAPRQGGVPPQIRRGDCPANAQATSLRPRSNATVFDSAKRSSFNLSTARSAPLLNLLEAAPSSYPLAVTA
jgi:hypothetical protein